MYYYNNKFNMDVEDVILDFLVHQKSKDSETSSSAETKINIEANAIESPEMPNYVNLKLNSNIQEYESKQAAYEDNRFFSVPAKDFSIDLDIF